MVSDMVMHQLLAWDCPEHKYTRTSCGGCLIIHRDVQFGHKLFPEIVILRNHAAPYPDPTIGQEAPFMTVEPFSDKDPPFAGVARDWQLNTAQELMCLKSMCLNSFHNTRLFYLHIVNINTSSPDVVYPIYFGGVKMVLGSPKVEPDSS